MHPRIAAFPVFTWRANVLVGRKFARQHYTPAPALQRPSAAPGSAERRLGSTEESALVHPPVYHAVTLPPPLNLAEAQHRAALHAAGVMHCMRPGARELSADVALGYLDALRPFVGFVGEESRERAENAITTMPCRPRDFSAGSSPQPAPTPEPVSVSPVGPTEWLLGRRS